MVNFTFEYSNMLTMAISAFIISASSTNLIKKLNATKILKRSRTSTMNVSDKLKDKDKQNQIGYQMTIF